MESYRKMAKRHQDDYNNFPLMAAFSEKQLQEGLIKLGLNPETGKKDIVSIGAGCFIRKSDVPAYKDMLHRHAEEMQAAINADTDGTGFIYGMFLHELQNHEFSFTGDVTDALNALGITPDDLEQKPALANGLLLACKAAMEDAE